MPTVARRASGHAGCPRTRLYVQHQPEPVAPLCARPAEDSRQAPACASWVTVLAVSTGQRAARIRGARASAAQGGRWQDTVPTVISDKAGVLAGAISSW